MSSPDGVTQEQVDAARMRQMLEHLPYFAVMIDRERRYVWVNRLDDTLSLGQVLGRRIDDFVHESALPIAIEAIERAFTTGKNVSYEARAYGQGGMEMWYGTTVVPLPVNEPGQERALLLSVDVTERNLAERALRASEQRFRMLTEASPDFILIVDADQRVVYINRDGASGEEARSSSDLVGRRVSELTHPEDAERAVSTVQRALLGGQAGAYEARSSGRERVLEARVIPLSGAGDHAQALIAATDVTEQRRAAAERAALTAQLQQAQKLETVGQLAGGIAHDFNNVLLVIQSRVDFCLAAVRKGEDPTEDLRAIEAAVERASNMTHRLLTIGRRQSHTPTTFDLAAFARETLDLLDRMMPESIAVDFSGPDEPMPVHADRAELQQVLINLCLNARDAIDGVGTIVVAVRREDSPSFGAPGDFLALSVSDTGTGMDPDTAARAFEPFFTTKPAGQGTGLGLSMVHGIVTANGGFVDVKTALGQGSTLTVLLPRHQKQPREQASQPAPESVRRGAGGRILVAEDEQGVRAAVVRILEHAGYEVFAVANGREAVDAFEEHGDDIDLVLLDAVMPVLSGKDAYEEITRLRADVPVLFSSGYATEILPAPFLEERGLRVLPKPYRPAVLLDVVRKALNR